MRNLLQRTVSGVIYLIVLVGSLFLGKYFFGVVYLLIGLLALVEFLDMAGIARHTRTNMTGIVTGSMVFILVYLVASRTLGSQFLSLAGLLPVLAFIAALYAAKTDFMTGYAKVFLGILYIIVPIALINFIVFPDITGNVYTHRIVLGILSLVWINDTGAYLSGSVFGRHKLFPRISPKKSWEGLIGGTVLTIVCSIWMDRLMGILSITDWAILAVIVSVFGVFGDLTESLIKRNAGKKDSGSLIPGHGGMLDRIDSILFVMPVSLVYLALKGL